MNITCEVLGISRSNVYQRLKELPRKKRESRGDEDILKKMLEIIKERAFYGYRRMKAILNREENQKRINEKRVYRLMKKNNLLLQGSRKKPTRTHDGKVMTIASNLRYCSDHFDIRCWNGDVVRVVFSLDTHDREIMAVKSTNGGMTGEIVRDLIVSTVEHRFGFNVVKLPKMIQWLSDNGPAYTARETINFARNLGFEVCTTPSYSPESNGMAKAFVKTFKRDYVYINDCSNAQVVIENLEKWFADYNEFAPHKALKQKSPREFIRAKLTEQVSVLIGSTPESTRIKFSRVLK